jgi:hypothetical protein
MRTWIRWSNTERFFMYANGGYQTRRNSAEVFGLGSFSQLMEHSSLNAPAHGHNVLLCQVRMTDAIVVQY